LPIHAVVVVVVTLLVVFVPGAVIATAAGARTALALASAPLVTYGLATATGTAAGYLDLRWGWWLLIGEALAVGAVLLLARSRGRGLTALLPRFGRPTGRDLVVGAGVLTGGLLSAYVLERSMAGLGRPHQDWDYTFHANATRFIADTRNVDPSALRAVNDWESGDFFYPNAYHAVAAVVRNVSGASIFEVLNGQTLLICAMAGLGLAALLREMRAPTPVVALTPVLLAGFASFPYDVLWRGPLLPYATGLALMPAFILLVRAVVDVRSPGSVVLAALGGAGLLGLQPATALSAAISALLFVAARWVSRRQVPVRELGLLLAAAVLTALLAAPDVLGSLRTSSGAATEVDWEAVETPGQAIGDLLFLDHGKPGPQLALALLVIVGLLSLRSARYMWWWLGSAGLAFYLFVLAASYDTDLAESVTRPWWNDRWRFAAWAVLGMAPLAAHGLWRIALAVTAWAGQDHRPLAGLRPWAQRTASAVVVLLVVVTVSSGLYTGDNGRRVAKAYQSDRYLNGAEVEAMAWLAPRVEEGETVMNDPGDGSAYMLALEGIRPLFGHQVPEVTYSYAGATQRALLERFDCLDSDDDVRAAIERLQVRYAFLGQGFVRKEAHRVAGMEGLSSSPSLRLVYDRGGVQVYEVDLQPLSDQPLAGCGESTSTDQPG
jgi:uncharacterized protein DUF6541